MKIAGLKLAKKRDFFGSPRFKNLEKLYQPIIRGRILLYLFIQVEDSDTPSWIRGELDGVSGMTM